jgi:hypothetical protein
MTKKSVSFKQLATWDSPSLCSIIEVWQEYDIKTILLVYAEFKRRNFDIPVNIKSCIRQFCISNDANDIDLFVNAYIKNQGYKDYDDYYENVVSIKAFIIEENTFNIESKPKENTKNNYKGFIILSIILILAAITNPNKEKHKESIKSIITANMQNTMQENMHLSNNKWEQAGQALGMMIGSTLIDPIIDNLISSDNYIFFSLTKITWGGKQKIIGFGLFGNVFITSKIEDTLKNSLLKENLDNI